MDSFSDNEKGILLVCCATLLFATQDAITKFLGVHLPLTQFIGIRYFFFLIIALWYAHLSGGIKANVKTKHPYKQILRGLLLAGELLLFAYTVQFVGVGYMHSVFAIYPIMVIAFSPWLLNEYVGWRRWLAVIIGFIGTLIIIGPNESLNWQFALYPLTCAFIFAIYSILTRQVAQDGEKPATSLFYTALVGAVLFAPMVPFVWQPIEVETGTALLGLIIIGSATHLMMISAYALAPASILQPFNYLTMPWAILIGYVFFSERLAMNAIVGAIIVVTSGLYIWWRERQIHPNIA